MAGRSILLAFALLCLACNRKSTDPNDGRELFANTCARCHGATGAGGAPVAFGGPSPRNFQDHDFQTSRTDDQLKSVIRNGKGTAMPAFAGAFNDTQLTALVAQIRSFDREAGAR